MARHSETPQKAPANFRDLPTKVVTSDGEGLWEVWHGSGYATTSACAACGNVSGNRKIYGNTGTSYPNGNSWDDEELVCGACGRFTLIFNFREG